MDTEFYPLCVVPAVTHGQGIRFLHPKEQYDITKFVDVIWAILAHCNGYESETRIMQQLQKEGVEGSVVRAILNDLGRLGVLIDSREVFGHFHAFSTNPMLYRRAWTFKDVAEFTASPRLPVRDGEVLDLANSDSVVASLLRQRTSCRSFSAEALTMKQLGQLCTSIYSVRDGTVPSAGGLYPLKVYLILTRDQVDADSGYYEYDPEMHQLVRFQSKVDGELLQYAFDSDSLLFGAPAIVVIAADLTRQPAKYSNRGYRYTILEAGHVAQNMHLVAAEMGLATLEYGGFLDTVLARELGMTDGREAPLITIAVGTASSEACFDSTTTLEALDREFVGRGRPVDKVFVASGNRPDKGETFFGALAHYASTPHQNARRTHHQRFGGGTATSASLARVKAIAEAYERFMSGRVRVDVTARARDLAEPWLDPRAVAPLTDRQYDTMPFLQPFDEEAVWQWVRGQMAHSGESILVPVDLAFYPLRAETFGRKLCHEACSSGVAAFTDRDEAVRRGLLELVERDAVMLNWFSRRPPRQVAHEQLPYHWQRRAEYWQARGRHVYVLDLSAHGAVVVNVAIVAETDYPCFVAGAAASERSFDEAVAKAFHEAETMLLQALRRPRQRRIGPEKVVHPADHARLYAHPDHLGNLSWLWLGKTATSIPRPTASIEGMLESFAAIVIDLSCGDSSLEVVRVISDALVPINFGCGNEHYTHRAAQGAVDPASLSLPHYFP